VRFVVAIACFSTTGVSSEEDVFCSLEDVTGLSSDEEVTGASSDEDVTVSDEVVTTSDVASSLVVVWLETSSLSFEDVFPEVPHATVKNIALAKTNIGMILFFFILLSLSFYNVKSKT